MYHVNDKGEAKPCSAKTPENCDFYRGENDSRHYVDMDEARVGAEDISFREAAKKGISQIPTIKRVKNSQPLSLIEELESDEEREATLKLIEELEEAGDDAAIMEILQRRTVGNPEFISATKIRDGLYHVMDTYNNEILVAKGILPGPDGEKNRSYVAIREATLKYRDIYEEVAVINRYLNEYRAVNAAAAMKATQIREDREIANGTFLTYEEETIGSLVAGGEFESGTPEWHEQRLGGIGGSDVSKIMRTDDKYAASNYRELLFNKLGLDEKQDESFRNDLTTAIGRGNAWEEAIRHMYADRNPDKNVAFCKTSWEGTGDVDYVRANFDGLELDENGKPTGIIEIKTGVHSPKWGSTKDGFEGMPANYRQQAIWYAGNAGLEDVTLVAVLDDFDYREYKFSMDDPRAQAEWAEMQTSTKEFWETIKDRREELSKGIDNVSSKRRYGFPKSVNMKTIAGKLCAYTGEDFDTAYARVRAEFKKVDKQGDYTREQIQSAVTAAYVHHDPNTRTKPFIGLDIETNHASSKRGRIIETGIVTLDPDGKIETKVSKLHGLSEKSAYGLGVGDSSIHRITTDMIQKKPLFETRANAREILKLLKSGTIVAHNAPFEKEWMAVNLPGFAEALDKKQVSFLDTQQLASHLMLDADDNSLNSFSEGNGIPYAGAHAATTDTLMMVKALKNFRSSLRNNGKFVPTEITDKAREEAEQEALIYDQNR